MAAAHPGIPVFEWRHSLGVNYTGRDMVTAHKGMKIGASDWEALGGHLHATLDAFEMPEAEYNEVVAFVESTKDDMVEA